MTRPAWASMIPVVAAGVAAVNLYSFVAWIASGAEETFFVGYVLFLTSGMGLIGSAIGFLLARLVPTSRVARVAVAGACTFLATLALWSSPGLLGGVVGATVVAAGAAGALALIEWRQFQRTARQPL